MKLQGNWKFKTLENLEKEVWGAPPYDSHLVIRIHELRKIPLIEFSIEDLRINIGQNFSLDYLIPLAIEKLEVNLFAEGDLYEADLLQAVLNVKSEYWINNKTYWKAIKDMISGSLTELDEMRIKHTEFLNLTF